MMKQKKKKACCMTGLTYIHIAASRDNETKYRIVDENSTLNKKIYKVINKSD